MRLTDEQRERVAAWVPLAQKLARNWCRARNIAGRRAEDVQSAFYLGLVRAVQSYDPTRGASMQTHLYLKVPRNAVDVLRAEWGRKGTGRAAFRSKTARTGLAIRLIESWYPGPDADVRAADVVAAVRRSLPEKHATVILGAVAGVPWCELAADLGVSKSRVSQLRAQAVEMLKTGGFMKGAL